MPIRDGLLTLMHDRHKNDSSSWHGSHHPLLRQAGWKHSNGMGNPAEKRGDQTPHAVMACGTPLQQKPSPPV
jgi:hypothetical protein